MASKSKNIAELLDANGDVLLPNLDNISVTAEDVSDMDNPSTGLFTLPSGTTAQRPSTAYVGAQRFNTDLEVMEFWNGTIWLKVSAELAVLTSVTGNIYAGIAGSNLTLTGTGFLTDNITVNFSQSSDGINTDVSVTAPSDTSATVAVPAAVYNNVTAGNSVTIKVTNSDNSQSSAVNKTAVALPSGGTVTTSGNYRIHTFTSSGTFTNTISGLTADYLIVAGGGGGGGGANSTYHGGGGGGAGGMRYLTSQSVSVTSHTVTVGTGGAAGGGAQSTGGNGSNGGNSSFNSTTSSGGGYGGGGLQNNPTAGNGGSGGGDGSAGDSAGGSGTAGQGNNGGLMVSGAGHGGDPYGGGGGGAGSAGTNNAVQQAGSGGNGSANSISGSSVTYAAGGGGGDALNAGNYAANGGGTGGSGGGGNGGSTGNGRSGSGSQGTDGLGGGGGGGQGGTPQYSGGDGGNGIVIIRWNATSV